MNRKILFFIILLINLTLVSSLSNQLDLNSINVNTNEIWDFNENNKIYVNSLGLNGSNVEISNISFRIEENISYNHTILYLSKGRHRIDVTISSSFIDGFNFIILCEDNGKVVEYSSFITMRKRSHFDLIKESLIKYSIILDDFFDMETLITFAYIFCVGIIICFLFFLSYKINSVRETG